MKFVKSISGSVSIESQKGDEAQLLKDGTIRMNEKLYNTILLSLIKLVTFVHAIHIERNTGNIRVETKWKLIAAVIESTQEVGIVLLTAELREQDEEHGRD